MDFFKVHDYIHSYNFPNYNFLLENKSFFDNCYEQQLPLPYGIANAMLDQGKMYQYLNLNFLKIISDYYLVSPQIERSSIGIYKQTNTQNTRVPHNHIDVASIVAVLYIDPPNPEDEGGITFYLKTLNNTLTINPIPGQAYFFPGWMYHTPEPQNSPISRISLNWTYSSHTRPIHKITGDRW